MSTTKSKTNINNEQYFFRYVENSETKALEKHWSKSMSSADRRLGMVLDFPLNRSGREAERTETLILSLPHLKASNPDQIKEQYLSLSHISSESLFGCFAKIYCLGFNFFASAPEAIAYQRAKKHRELIAKIDNALINAEMAFTFDAVCAWVIKGAPANKPRSANRVWDGETMLKLARNTFGKKEPEQEFCSVLSQTMLSLASSWDDVTAEDTATAVLATLDQLFGVKASISSVIDAILEPELPADASDLQKALASRTIAWSGDAATEEADISEEYFLHQSINRAAILASKQTVGMGLLSAKAVSEQLLDAKFNAMSWLFGRGMRELSGADATELAGLLQCPEPAARSLINILKQSNSKIDGSWSSASDYRTHVGGAILSFIEIYWQRLTELNTYLNELDSVLDESLPELLFDVDNEYSERLFLGVPCSAQQLQHRWRTLKDNHRLIADLVGKMVAGDPALLKADIIKSEDFESIHTFISEVADTGSLLNRVLNNLEQMKLEAEKTKSESLKAEIEDFAETLAFPPKILSALKGEVSEAVQAVGKRGLFDPPALNRIGRERAFTGKSYEVAQAGLASSIGWLDKYLSGFGSTTQYIDAVLTTYRQREKRRKAFIKEPVSDEALNILSRRQLLNEWFSFWRNLSEEARVYGAAKLTRAGYGFYSRKEKVSWANIVHNFMFERKGGFYVSPFSRRQHAAYAVDEGKLASFNLEQLITEMIKWAEARKNSSPEALLDYTRVICKRANFVAKGLNGDVSSELVDPRKTAPECLDLSLYRADEQILEHEKQITPELVQKIVGRVEGAIRDVAAIISKQEAVEKYSFKPTSETKKLAILLKEADANGVPVRWVPPHWITGGNSAASKVWADLATSLESDDDGAYAMSDIVKALTASKFKGGAGALMAELPHLWGWFPRCDGLAVEQAYTPKFQGLVLSVEKNSITKANKLQGFTQFRAPPKYLNMLDDILRGKTANGAGGIVVKLHYKKDGGTFVYADSTVELHQPIAVSAPDVESDPAYFDRMIGIDFGERGIGYSVRSVKAGEFGHLIERGFVRIPAIRKLIKSSETYRKKHVRRMVNGRHSFVDLGKMRKAVAGEVFSAIKNLMWLHKGFPVLEDSITSLDKGSRQLSHVYTEAQSYFVMADAKTLNNQREHKWRGKYMAHPYLQQKGSDKKSKKEKLKPLNLFPGVKVSAAGSSQECSCCRRNASKTLRNMKGSRIEIAEGGRVVLENGTIVLAVSKIEGDSRTYFPFQQQSLPKAKVESEVKRLRRLKQINPHAQDTSQSIYCCPYEDCDQHRADVHADVNAADVLVQRKLDRLVVGI